MGRWGRLGLILRALFHRRAKGSAGGGVQGQDGPTPPAEERAAARAPGLAPESARAEARLGPGDLLRALTAFRLSTAAARWRDGGV
jgi:hypothetical protein